MKTCAAILTGLLLFSQFAGAQVSFKKHTLLNVFISEGAATGDVNRDGKTDILAGFYWFEAPGWKRHVVHADTLNHLPGYCTTFLNFCTDVNNDGWPDLIRFDQPGDVCVWYENPRGKEVLWKSHLILANAGNETPIFVDVDNDGKKDIICNDSRNRQVLWIKAPSKKGDTAWTKHIISNDSLLGTHKYTHGLGWGDVNKDGRNDVIIREGWWESPANVTQENWRFHPAALGEEASNMFVLDADGDGDMDVISASAHKYGIWWHEQKSDGFVTHEIGKQFSQTHSMALEDMNNDGHPDLVTGKRYFAHNGKDPGAFEPAVLYWFEYKPGKTPSWTPHQIDDNSGVGNSFTVTDLNKDGLLDIITSNKKGVYYFEQVKK
ncbi:FG-GAP repeat domain-containing protein [Chitinophaga sp. GCM10012297]|uniref:VCBS repeat-containing protein n=1 Tax=Chitinophaga chungangae TaxID=2821488 RepID=A0ABS3Y9M0_9BACT|nr:VCBS repeat-containing protein [Chitinophaga chungangae]MBO9150834.1 VCBS repeat-containing protein [Chitinophaga chungangae]